VGRYEGHGDRRVNSGRVGGWLDVIGGYKGRRGEEWER
jgi:hypothetical protein